MKVLPLGFWALSTLGETTSFLVKNEGFCMLLDMGLNPSFQLAKAGYKLTNITHLFISHSHSDHLQGFANLVFTRSVQERKLSKAQILNIMASDINIENCKNLLKIFYSERDFNLNWIEVNEGIEFPLSNKYRVNFMQAEHTVETLSICILLVQKSLFFYF